MSKPCKSSTQALLPDLTIYRDFDDFVLQKEHVDDLTIYFKLKNFLENYLYKQYLCTKVLNRLCGSLNLILGPPSNISFQLLLIS